MATPTTQAAAIPSLTPKVAASRHWLYELLMDEWQKLGHVREGTGGFKDGTYLVAHPREWLDHTAKATTTDANGVATTVTSVNPNPKKPSPKLKARRAIARYDNVAGAILEAKKAALFRESPTRRVGAASEVAREPSELERWWSDIDGNGMHIDDALPTWWDLAATFGHVVAYMDRPSEAADDGAAPPVTAADQPRDWPYVRIYTPLDVLSWLVDENGQIISMKVVEVVPPSDYDAMHVTQYRVRVIDRAGWKLYDYRTGAAVDQGPHAFGVMPIAFLYGKRRAILGDVGQSVLGDPKLYIDRYNLVSELRELLRNQTFSFINLPLGTGPDAMTVEAAQAMMGSQTGTMNVLFSGAAASVLTADASNVAAYQEDIKNLTRDIYRQTGVQWEADSKDAEATGSLVMKREEMNTRLAAYADECELFEYRLVELWYRATYGPDQGPKKLEADQVSIHYPERFAVTPFVDVLAQVQAAQSIGMPSLFLKELRKSLVTKFEGMANLAPDILKKINGEIDKAPDDPTPAERMQQRIDLMAGKAPSGPQPPPKPNAAGAKA